MTDILIGFLNKKLDGKSENLRRTQTGKFASKVGVLCNLLLCFLKGIIGMAFGSVSITADAVNNLSDAGNSVISLLGFTAAGKPADKKHPYGHARIEYISCLTVSFLIVTLGLSTFKSAVEKIFVPHTVIFGILPAATLVFSIAVKLWMAYFYKKIANLINSDVIAANAADSLNDVVSTAAVLITGVVSVFWKVNLDSYVGIAVASFIVYTGVKIILQTCDRLMGTVPDAELIAEITQKISSYKGIIGIHDLAVHSYGPDKYFATVHAEVSAKLSLTECHEIIDKIERDFLSESNINLVIHPDPLSVDDSATEKAKSEVLKVLREIDENLSMHDFRMTKSENTQKLIFDVVVPHTLKISDSELVFKTETMLRKIDSRYICVITVDRNYIA